MAVDDREKRLSMLTFSVEDLLPDPSGTVDADARSTFLLLYMGIPLSNVVAAAIDIFSGRRRRMAGRRLSSILVILMLAGCASKPCSTGEYNCVDFSQAWDAAVEARKEVIRERSI